MKKIDSYFSRVTANRHACNMYVGGGTFDPKFHAEKEAKREIDDRVKERREAAKRMRPVRDRDSHRGRRFRSRRGVDLRWFDRWWQWKWWWLSCIMLEIPMFFFIFLFPIFTLSFHLSQRCNPVVFIYLFISFTLIHLFPSWRGWCYSPHYIERTNLITMIDFYEKSSELTSL